MPYKQCFESGFIEFGSGIVSWIPVGTDLDPDPGFWLPNIDNDDNLLIKNLSIRTSKLQEKPSPLKREHSALQTSKFLDFFSIFVGNFCPSGFGSEFRIRIQIHWPDWIRIRIRNTANKNTIKHKVKTKAMQEKKGWCSNSWNTWEGPR